MAISARTCSISFRSCGHFPVRSAAIASWRTIWRRRRWQKLGNRVTPSGRDRILKHGSSQFCAISSTPTEGGLPAEQREALILVGAGGFSYEDAARIANCAVGTVKSRVARARKALFAALEGHGPLSNEPRLGGGDATNEIMAQLDRLAPPEASD